MNIILLGAAGFIGTNLIYKLAKEPSNSITAVDIDLKYFEGMNKSELTNVRFIEDELNASSNLKDILNGQDIVYHLVSKSSPSNSNERIANDISEGVEFTSSLLEACVACNVKKVVFISSGGTVYGKNVECPVNEDSQTFPISSYGIQKLTIEKLLFLYNYLYGLDYCIIRLANPYGPYQRPNGALGVVTTFIYKALSDEQIYVYGDGSVVRDFIYIDDAVEGIIKLSNANSCDRIYNLGSGKGTSVKKIIDRIQSVLNKELSVEYISARSVDVSANFLDISRYEREFGKACQVTLEEGIAKTAEFLKKRYNL